jgi:hypothetical protein
MRQYISGNVGFRFDCRAIALAVLLLVNLFVFSTSIGADSLIFKYEDDSGTITFTEQWDSIPIKYREQSWPHLFRQTFLSHKWSLTTMAYAAVGNAGRLSKYTPSGVWPSSARCGLFWL